MIESHPKPAAALPEATVKQCCATFYGSDSARFLLGDSFHPGGTQLTHELAERLGLGRNSRVLDIASGRGTSALYLAEHFACEVVGVDLSEDNVRVATAEAVDRHLSAQVHFTVGDAEHLALSDGSFSALICECAFCTFPDKAAAVREFYRVLVPGGRLGLTDVTKAGVTSPALAGLLAWIACIGDAQTADRYEAWLDSGGFKIDERLDRIECLGEMVRQVRGRMLVAEVMVGLRKLDIPGLDLAQAKHFVIAASEAVIKRELGYVLLAATKPFLRTSLTIGSGF